MSRKNSKQSKETPTQNSSPPLVEPLDGNDKGRIRLFVYGTLKSGHHNSRLLSRVGAKFMGSDTITGPFDMVSLGGFPGVVYDNRCKGAMSVFGEVYHFDPDGLETFDWLEGYPRFYGRTKFRTDFMDKRVWMYHLPYEPYTNGKYDRIDTGLWAPTEAELAVWNHRGVSFKDGNVIYS
jgi:gamma-glutamylcyclotransferase (GGCT)/AIG2-like uncharacterized protein YtfP